jgi:hypothetical protein
MSVGATGLESNRSSFPSPRAGGVRFTLCLPKQKYATLLAVTLRSGETQDLGDITVHLPNAVSE